MTNKEEQIHILTMLSRGYLLPISIYDKNNIKQILSATFTVDGKEAPILKNYKVELNDVLTGTLDPRFNLNNY